MNINKGIKPSKLFIRNNEHLIYETEIDFPTAVLAADVITMFFCFEFIAQFILLN